MVLSSLAFGSLQKLSSIAVSLQESTHGDLEVVNMVFIDVMVTLYSSNLYRLIVHFKS